MRDDLGLPALLEPGARPRTRVIRRGVLTSVLASLWLTLPALTSCRRASEGAIMVTVTTPANQPVDHAIVTVLNPRTNTSIGARPDGTGKYRTPYLPEATYTVVVRKEGFRPELKANIRVGDSPIVSIGVQLVPNAGSSGTPSATW